MQSLEIQDDCLDESVFYEQEKDKTEQQVEVHVLQSGQIEFSTPTTTASADPLLCYSSNVDCDGALPSTGSQSVSMTKHQAGTPKEKDERTQTEPGVGAQCSILTTMDVQPSSTGAQCSTVDVTNTVTQPSMLILASSMDVSQPERMQLTAAQTSTLSSSIDVRMQPTASTGASSMDISTQTVQPSLQPSLQPSFYPPHINQENRHSVAGIDSNTSQYFTSTTLPPPDQPDMETNKTGSLLRRSSRRLSQKSNTEESTTSPNRNRVTYNLRCKQNLSATDTSPSPAKKTKQLDGSVQCSSHSESRCDNGEGMKCDPFQWGVDEVVRFISSVPRCNYTEVFREHVSIINTYIYVP